MFKQNIQCALLLSIGCCTSIANAGTFDDAINNAELSGKFRYGNISSGSGSNIAAGSAFGGEIKLETKKIDHLQFAIAPYFSEKASSFAGTSDNNNDFLDENNDSFSYIGEAYISYSTKKGSLRLGKQKIDTPFINTDDIRMFSNTFNAIWLNMAFSPKLKLQAGQVESWAGFDSGSGQEVFKAAAGNKGVTAIGLNYDITDSSSGQFWHYNFDAQYSLLYTDISHQNDKFEVAAQFANYTRQSGSNIEGNVIGATASFYVRTVTLSLAKNISVNSGDKIIDPGLGLGGGNFYASMDESTIGGLNNASATVYSIELAISEDLSITAALGHFENSDKTTNSDEQNLVFNYDITNQFNLEIIQTTLNNKVTPTDNLIRQTARLTYTF